MIFFISLFVAVLLASFAIVSSFLLLKNPFFVPTRTDYSFSPPDSSISTDNINKSNGSVDIFDKLFYDSPIGATKDTPKLSNNRTNGSLPAASVSTKNAGEATPKIFEQHYLTLYRAMIIDQTVTPKFVVCSLFISSDVTLIWLMEYTHLVH